MQSNYTHSRNNICVGKRGFTLVEMLVVLAIISVITTIALVGQTTFNRSVLLTDASYTVALSLREAQSFGIASRKFGAVQNAGYGGRFVANTNTYTIFADIGGGSPQSNCPIGTVGTPDRKPGNCIYDSGTDGVLNTYNFDRGFTIAQICGTALVGGVKYCSTDSSSPLSALDVVFIRSNTTDSVITGQRNGSSVQLSKGEVYLRDAEGVTTRGVCISQIGQISVAYGTCP